jgi:hypothetical protein
MPLSGRSVLRALGGGQSGRSHRFQRGGPGFRANTTAPELRRLLGLPEGS